MLKQITSFAFVCKMCLSNFRELSSRCAHNGDTERDRRHALCCGVRRTIDRTCRVLLCCQMHDLSSTHAAVLSELSGQRTVHKTRAFALAESLNLSVCGAHSTGFPVVTTSAYAGLFARFCFPVYYTASLHTKPVLHRSNIDIKLPRRRASTERVHFGYGIIAYRARVMYKNKARCCICCSVQQ